MPFKNPPRELEDQAVSIYHGLAFYEEVSIHDKHALRNLVLTRYTRTYVETGVRYHCVLATLTQADADALLDKWNRATKGIWKYAYA